MIGKKTALEKEWKNFLKREEKVRRKREKKDGYSLGLHSIATFLSFISHRVVIKKT